MQEILRGGRLMVAVATAVQDQSGGMRSNTVNGVALSSGLHNVTGLQLNEQFSCGNDYAPKVRKPYTITKQRERWTDEEHKKFIEALKLYGRAWRRIEEHVGTKTAVQIRSHAQKFFSKVVRESSGNNINSVEPIEIPPPRPKRKPMHPYPRKSVNPLTKETSVPEQTRTSSSPNLSVSELENQSPTSVLSAVASDALGSTDSDTPNGSLSPVSSAAYVNCGGFTLSEPYPLPEENGSTSAVLGAAGSVADEKQSTNLELFSQDNIFAGEEEATTRSLKLFGRTVLVTDSSKPSSPTVLDMNRGKPVQPLARKVVGTEALSGNSEFTWCHSPSEAPGAPYLMQHQNRKSNPSEAGSGAPLSCWTFYGGVQLPVVSFCKSEPAYSHLHPNMCGVLELQKEGSWTGSNSGSANDAGDAEKNADVETQSCQFPFDKEEKQLHRVLEFRPSERSAFSELRASPEKHMRGFVPYKKRRIAEEDTLSSAITGKDGVDEEVCLCL